MSKIVIIGSDSFIATQFYNSIDKNESLKLFSRVSSGKHGETVKDLFKISNEDLKDVEIVINFAAIVHQPKLKDDELYIRVNTELAIHIAELAKKAGVKHFIQMSTIAVYGEVNFVNDKTPLKSTNIYGRTKLEADIRLQNMQDATFKVTIVRPPMVYGGGKAPGNLQNLMKYAEKGIPMPFKGVVNKRDFVHVGNLVKALNAIIEKNLYGVVIPTDMEAISTEQIINIIKKYSDKKVRQIKIPKIIHSMIKAIKPEIYTKVFGDLQVQCNLSNEVYNPKLTIEDGIKEMIDSM